MQSLLLLSFECNFCHCHCNEHNEIVISLHRSSRKFCHFRIYQAIKKDHFHSQSLTWFSQKSFSSLWAPATLYSFASIKKFMCLWKVNNNMYQTTSDSISSTFSSPFNREIKFNLLSTKESTLLQVFLIETLTHQHLMHQTAELNSK